jgi:hypothetical protein
MLTFANALSQAVPTQAHLGLTPLQRTGITGAVGRATPEPGAATQAAGAPTGVALPGTATEGADERTMLRPGEASAVAPEGARTGVGIGSMELDHARPADASLPPVAPRSKWPLLGGLVLAALVLAGGAYLAFARPSATGQDGARGSTTTTPSPPPKPAEVAAPASGSGKTPAPQEDTAAVEAIAAVAAKAMREQAARESLGRAKTEFSLANLDEAETRLKEVGEDTPSFAEAKRLLEQIDAIRQKLAQARSLRAQGQCSAALPVYEAVLKLNPRVGEALEGVRFCKASSISTTIE